MPRPTKLTPSIQDEIIAALEANATYEIAAQYAGISYHTLLNWRKRGQQVHDRIQALGDDAVLKVLTRREMALPEAERPDGITPDDWKYFKFFQAVEETVAVAAVNWLQVIDRAASTDPNWAAWMLRMRFPDAYGGGQKQQVEVSTPANHPLEVNHSGTVETEVTVDQIAGILGILADVGALESAGLETPGEAGDPTADAVHPDPTDG